MREWPSLLRAPVTPASSESWSWISPLGRPKRSTPTLGRIRRWPHWAGRAALPAAKRALNDSRQRSAASQPNALPRRAGRRPALSLAYRAASLWWLDAEARRSFPNGGASYPREARSRVPACSRLPKSADRLLFRNGCRGRLPTHLLVPCQHRDSAPSHRSSLRPSATLFCFFS